MPAQRQARGQGPVQDDFARVAGPKIRPLGDPLLGPERRIDAENIDLGDTLWFPVGIRVRNAPFEQESGRLVFGGELRRELRGRIALEPSLRRSSRADRA